MCLTTPARVLATDGETATVEMGGVRRTASTLLLPDVLPGDLVLVGLGSVLSRLDPDEAEWLEVQLAVLETGRPSAPAITDFKGEVS